MKWIIPILILAIILIVLLSLFFVTYKATPVDNSSVIAIADSSNAYSTLNKLVLNQNEFINCTDDIVKLYQERGITIPSNVANANKICKVTLDKQVVAEGNNYVVIYTQLMPESCTKPSQPNLLNITVNVQTNQTTASWISGSDPSQWSSFSTVEELADAPDCATYINIFNKTLG